ncbi:hypothetical protein [Pseudoclavibacter soli]|uniref:hypothetical protein n=1 Tax=Pseudoclavibacter soli TaxID=452623 RepID=UPI0004876FF0|nr:hypothetical protein [Pseudoclavibacter soli]
MSSSPVPTVSQLEAIALDLHTAVLDPRLRLDHAPPLSEVIMGTTASGTYWRWESETALLTGWRTPDGSGWFSAAALTWVRNSPKTVQEMVRIAEQLRTAAGG